MKINELYIIATYAKNNCLDACGFFSVGDCTFKFSHKSFELHPLYKALPTLPALSAEHQNP